MDLMQVTFDFNRLYILKDPISQWHREGFAHLSLIVFNITHPQKFWLIKKVQVFTWKWIFYKVSLTQDLVSYSFHHGTHLQISISILDFSHFSLSTIISVWSISYWWQFLPLNFFSKYKNYHQSSFLIHLYGIFNKANFCKFWFQFIFCNYISTSIRTTSSIREDLKLQNKGLIASCQPQSWFSILPYLSLWEKRYLCLKVKIHRETNFFWCLTLTSIFIHSFIPSALKTMSYKPK